MGIGYYNPYCVSCQPIDVGDGVMIDYSQPLDATTYFDPATQTDYPSDALVVSDQAVQAVDTARAAFLRADYNLALQYLNSALARMPRDSSIHEFRALVLFALGRYGEAALTLNSVLAAGPGWNWTTLIGFYPSVAVYATQRQALEAYSRQNPDAADGHFVLGYHYMTAGYNDAAIGHFQEVLRVAPKDGVARLLLDQLAPPQDTTTGTPPGFIPAPTEPLQPAGAAIEPRALVGTWTAAQPDGVSFELVLNADSTFKWTFIRQGKSTVMNGTYTLGHNTLLLEDPDAGPMSGQIGLGADKSLTFRIPGAPAGQGELVFHR